MNDFTFIGLLKLIKFTARFPIFFSILILIGLVATTVIMGQSIIGFTFIVLSIAWAITFISVLLISGDQNSIRYRMIPYRSTRRMSGQMTPPSMDLPGNIYLGFRRITGISQRYSSNHDYNIEFGYSSVCDWNLALIQVLGMVLQIKLNYIINNINAEADKLTFKTK